MSVRIPYSYEYKSFKNSRLATNVDRFLHNFPLCMCFTNIVIIPIVFLYYFCLRVHSCPEIITNIGKIFTISFVLVAFILPFFAGLLCDKLRISERIAVWDITGRRKTKKLYILIVIFVFIIIIPIAVNLICVSLNASYHSKMNNINTSTVVEGDMIVSLIDGKYSTCNIPKELQANTPEEVRYIVNYLDGKDLVGSYGLYCCGYQKWQDVKIVERISNEIIASKRFYGGYPPVSVDGSESEYYGSDVDGKEVEQWISQIYQQKCQK